MSLLDSGRFLYAFLRHPVTVGAFAPSSRVLARAMCADMQVEPDALVLEFGPGTGPFTRQIKRKLPDPSCYLGVELEFEFIRLLRSRHPELAFMHGSAEDADALCGHSQDRTVSSIISGLPFANLPRQTQDGVLASVARLLRQGGMFRTFQYVHSYALPGAIRFRRRVSALFGQPHQRRVVFRNVPPAFILSWHGATGTPVGVEPEQAVLRRQVSPL
jgi:phosphatidylethanolamine/phosphatidyl-N-methylethanolamine N-methyltransferase